MKFNQLVRLVSSGFFLLMAECICAQKLLTMEEALKIAETNSPNIRSSYLSLVRSQKNLEAQRAGLKSKFSLDVSPIEYSRQREFNGSFNKWVTSELTKSGTQFRVSQPILITDGTVSLINDFGWQKSFNDFQNSTQKSFNNNLYLSYNQPLFTYNKTRLQLKELELDYENSNLSYAMQRLSLEKNVSQFFYNIYMAQMSLKIARDELANTEKNFEIIKNKVEAGLARKEELYQAELNLATSKSALKNKQVSLENAKDEFKNFVGMSLNEDFVVLTDITTNPVEVEINKAIDQALAARMEIRQREISIEQSQFQLIRTKALNEFKGDLQLSVGIVGDNENLPDIYSKPTQSPRVAISFNVPIFDWGEKKARIEAQEAAIEVEHINADQEKKQIEIDIRKVYRNLQNQLDQIEIAKTNQRNAELTYEINLERYKNGDLTGMDLNLYQNQLSQKKMDYAQALINYKLELLNLKIQTLYDFEKNESIVPAQLINKNR